MVLFMLKCYFCRLKSSHIAPLEGAALACFNLIWGYVKSEFNAILSQKEPKKSA